MIIQLPPIETAVAGFESPLSEAHVQPIKAPEADIIAVCCPIVLSLDCQLC